MTERKYIHCRRCEALIPSHKAGPYCSDKCRMLKKFVRRENGCLEYLGGKDKDGYGKVYYNGEHRRTHTVMYEEFVGPIPQGCMICHTCDSTACGEPTHLFAGTAQDNALDMHKKRRAAFPAGGRGPRAGKIKMRGTVIH